MYCWLLGAVGFAVAYLVGSPTSSALTQAMKEEVYSLHRAARTGRETIIVLFACNLTQVLCDLLSKTYLAQMAYVDMAIVSFTRAWHAEQGDDAEVVAQRNRELADVAAALRLDLNGSSPSLRLGESRSHAPAETEAI